MFFEINQRFCNSKITATMISHVSTINKIGIFTVFIKFEAMFWIVTYNVTFIYKGKKEGLPSISVIW